MKTLANYEEVGALLHRKPDTIYRWARDGYIPSVPVRDEYVFDLDKVARWVEGHKQFGRTGRMQKAEKKRQRALR